MLVLPGEATEQQRGMITLVRSERIFRRLLNMIDLFIFQAGLLHQANTLFRQLLLYRINGTFYGRFDL